MMNQGINLKKGLITREIYTLIKERRYKDLIECFGYFGGDSMNTRAGLSILGYCYYHCQMYEEAATCYENLSTLIPNEGKYKFYCAQSLYQAGLFADALRMLKKIFNLNNFKNEIQQLHSAILYSSEDYAGTQTILNKLPEAGNANILNDEGCLLYQANQFELATERFNAALQIGGFNPLMAYNLSLAHFRTGDKTLAIKYIHEILDRGIRNHPELGIGAQIDAGNQVQNMNGNTIVMAISGVAQAINLRAAIEYQEGNVDGARETLLEMPPRSESELDPITLHNMALTEPNGPAAGLRKLTFLLKLGPPACPAEAFANILLICTKHEMYDEAASILAEHTHLTYKYLPQYLYELLDALITSHSSKELAENKFNSLSADLSGKLRMLAAKVKETRSTMNQNALRNVLKDYSVALEYYLSVVMARAWLAWRDNDFVGAEKEFRLSAHFCSENSIWRQNAGHVLFMQGDKYKEAVAFYEPIVRQRLDDIMSIPAEVLANLCVSYIMTFQNEDAEELMRKVEKAEDMKSNSNESGKQYRHLCIINLVVGTLYCAKSNYEFGLSRISHALEGGSVNRLHADTWLHVKRCVLGLLAGMSKQNLILPHPGLKEILDFLHSCEVYGILIPANTNIDAINGSKNHLTIGQEARKLRLLLILLCEYRIHHGNDDLQLMNF